MKKAPYKLLLVTYRFPFLPGEYFLESEMKHLAEAFDEVLVFPARRVWNTETTHPRDLPNGVRLFDPRAAGRMRILLWYLLAVLQVVPKWFVAKSIWPGAKSVKQFSITKWLRSSLKVAVAEAALDHFLKNENRSHLIAYAYWRDESAGALAWMKRAGKLKYVFLRCHGSDLYQPDRMPFEGLIHEEADGIFPVSTDGQRYLTQTKGLPASNIAVQRLGVRLPNQFCAPSQDGIWRIVSCSNVVPVKRVDLIARVIGRLANSVEWTHIGDGSEIHKVLEVTKTFSSDHKVSFPGRVSNEDVLGHYQKHPIDLFINLSESEGVPVAIMEALAHGIPVLATDVGGSSEVVGADNGCLIHVDLPLEDIVLTIEHFFRNSGNPSQVRHAARRIASERCSARINYRIFCGTIIGHVDRANPSRQIDSLLRA